MNIRQIFNKVTNQWPAKVICLIIAIFLYVFHQISLIDKKSFNYNDLEEHEIPFIVINQKKARTRYRYDVDAFLCSNK